MKVKHGGKALMDIAVDAASTVLDSLNSNDRVSGIVKYSRTPNSGHPFLSGHPFSTDTKPRS